MIETLFPLWVAILANVLAQVMKPFIYGYRSGKFDFHHTFACGGFPSSHTSTVTALTVAVGLVEGFDSTFFAITAIFSAIVIYDAVNVRYYAGKNIELTQQIVNDLVDMIKLPLDDPIYHEKMKDVLGHRYVEVVGGFFLGIIVVLVSAAIVGLI